MTRWTKNGLTTLAALSLLLVADPSLGVRKNGFVLDDSLVPSREILSGGPPRDGIPSIDRPRFVLATEAARFLREKDRRNYGDDPYPGYESSRRVIFPVSNRDGRYHPKERVIGLLVNGRAKAYPFVELDRAGGRVEDVFAERSLTVEFDAEHQTARVVDAKGQEVPTVIAYWFAWQAFYPKGEVFAAD